MFVDRTMLVAFLADLDARYGRAGRLYLVGEASQLYEGGRRWIEQVVLTAEVPPLDRAAFDTALRAAQAAVDVVEEHPGDMIPLPEGFVDRAIVATPRDGDPPIRHLALYHFDPYSVAFRYLARGDEVDYQLVLAFLDQRWVTMQRMEALLDDLLPRFSFETIQQDPAEFRRRFKGLKQMWKAAGAEATSA